MHELSMAMSILETAHVEAAKQSSRLTKIALRIGALSGIDVDALRFGFEALVKDTPDEQVAVDIAWFPRRQRCGACAHEFSPEQYELDLACPRCGGATACVSGEELDIAYIEVEES